MQDLFLHNLTEIRLSYCERCELLPTFGKLPFLKDLTITGMHAVKYIGNEFHGDSAISFPSLRSFNLLCVDNLEKWGKINERESFSHLSRLSISYCPKLVELPIIPSLTSLYITSCPKIIELPIIPSLTRLYIEINCATLFSSVMNLTSLSDLALFSSVMIVLPDGLFQKHKMLESLNIPLVRNFKPLANQLNNLSTLKDLKLSCCDEIENLLDTLQNMHSLRLLEIVGFKFFLSFPANGLRDLSSLQKLWIKDCDALYSLSEGIQYLTNLEDLIIKRCPKLMSLPEGIQHLTALSTLRIYVCEFSMNE
ncbi:putative disease resistance protein RGA1 isoform X2 [Quercus suber]|uniref:putative disease resistance protein RGA1 isoform X2 n=1 Tax=Quercus suber TaxID=58331 RepID=UPI0032DEB636